MDIALTKRVRERALPASEVRHPGEAMILNAWDTQSAVFRKRSARNQSDGSEGLMASSTIVRDEVTSSGEKVISSSEIHAAC